MTVRFYKANLPGTGYREDWCDFASGRTIADTIGTTEVRAWINGREVTADFMRSARLKDGLEVYVEPIPKDPVSLSVAAAVAAGAAGATAGATAIALTVLSIGLSVGANLLAQKQAKNKGSQRGAFDRLNSITGTSNQVASFEAIPRLFGRMRYFPPIPMTAQPYTELKGDDQYLRMLFCLGYGPLDLSGHTVGAGYPKLTEATTLDPVLGQPAIRIGDTDIAEYEDLEYEIGAPDQMSLYTDQIIETQPNWDTESDQDTADRQYDASAQRFITRADDGDQTTRTTDTGAVEISVDLRGQLYSVDSKGRFSDLDVHWRIEWRLSGDTGAWQSDTFVQHSDGQSTSTASYRITRLPNDGGQRYDVRLTRLYTVYEDLEGRASTKVTWTALRTVRDHRAFVVPGTVVMSLRIRATDQLNGTIDKLSVLATSVLDVYDTDADRWVKRPTRAHAWAFASILTDQANRQPIDKSDLNLRSLLAWEAETEAAGRHYDTVFDDDDTTLDRMQDVCAGGRATWTIDPDTSIRIVLDTPQSVPKMLVSPYNSFGYSYRMNAFDPPHAVKMRYIDTETWQNTERTVYDDGYDASNATVFETVDAVGCTDHNQAWKDGRRYLAKRRLRDIEQHTFSQDIQHYKYGVGDLLELANETILVSLAYGRLNRVTTNDAGQAMAVTANTFLPMEHGNRQYGLKIHRMDGSIVVVNVRNDTPGDQRVVLDHPVDDIEPDCHIVFGETGKITTDVKVSTITPQGDTAQIVCVPAALNILDAETGDIPAPPDDISLPPDPAKRGPNSPTIGTPISDASVALTNDDGSLTWRVAVPVQANSGRVHTDHIDVQCKTNDAPTYDTQRARDGMAYFTGYQPGDVVTIRARSYGDGGRPSAWVYVHDYTVTGRVPLAPTGLRIVPHTLTADLDPIGGKPGSKYEFFISGTALDPDDIEADATRLNQQPASVWTATDLQPDTDYVAYVRTRNLYAASQFISQSFHTRDDASALLKAINGKLDKTALNQALQGELEQIVPPDAIQDIITSRLSDEQLAHLQDIQDETQARKDGDTQVYDDAKTYADTDSQAAQTVQQLVATFGGNTADALSYTLTQVDSESTLATRVNQLEADYGDLNNAQISENATAIADATGSYGSLRESIDTRFSNQSDEIDGKASITYVDESVSDEQGERVRQYNSLSARLDDKAGIDNSGQVLQNNQVLVSASSGPFAQATRQVSVSDGDSTATIQQQFTAQRSDIGGLQATWTVRIEGKTADGDPVVGGLGLGASNGSSNFIVSADNIAFGKVGHSGIDYPFYFDTDAQRAILKEANIGSLTFTKLKDASGNLVVDSQGRIKADYIETERLVVSYGDIQGSKPPADADRTAINTSQDTQNVGGRSSGDVKSGIDSAKNLSADAIKQLVKGADNKVKTPTFADGSIGDWPGNYGGNGFLQIRSRNNIEDHEFEVSPGEKLYFYAIVDSTHANYGVQFGLTYSGAGSDFACSIDTGRFRDPMSGSLIVPDDVSFAKPFFLIDGFGDVGHAFVKSLFIGKYQPGSDITGENTAGDVQHGDDKAVRQRGADNTASNKSADTALVAGTSAAQVRDRSNDGHGANVRVNEWTRPNSTLIWGNQISTADAYVDTLVIRGEAVTFTDQVYKPDRLVGGDSGDAVYGYDQWYTVLTYYTSNVQHTRAQVMAAFGYRGNNDNDMNLRVRLKRETTNTTHSEIEQTILANYVGGGADNQYMGGTFCYPFYATDMYIGNSFKFSLQVYISAGKLVTSDYAMAYIGLKR